MKIFSIVALMLLSICSFAHAQDDMTPITVSVDIKPGSCPNAIGLADNKGKGVVPFAIMGTVSGFDIMGTVEEFDVSQIDPESIRIIREDAPGTGAVTPIRWTYEDVATPEDEPCDCDSRKHEEDHNSWKDDGQMDLLMKVYRADLIEYLELDETAGDEIELTIIGNLKEEFGGTPIEGKDCVRVLQAKHEKIKHEGKGKNCVRDLQKVIKQLLKKGK